MPSMSLALRLGQPMPCCPLAFTKTLASHQFCFTLTVLQSLSISLQRWKHIYRGELGISLKICSALGNMCMKLKGAVGSSLGTPKLMESNATVVQ